MQISDAMVEAALQGAEYVPNPDNREWMRAALGAAFAAQPQAGEWVTWAGGEFMPVPGEMIVRVLLRDGTVEGPAKAVEFAGAESCWRHRGSNGDIVGYSIINAASPATESKEGESHD